MCDDSLEEVVIKETVVINEISKGGTQWISGGGKLIRETGFKGGYAIGESFNYSVVVGGTVLSGNTTIMEISSGGTQWISGGGKPIIDAGLKEGYVIGEPYEVEVYVKKKPADYDKK